MLSRLRSLILDPPGLRFGSCLAPKIVETCLEIPLGAPKSRSKDLFFGPGGLQERSKRPTEGQNKGTERATRAKRHPRGVQDRFGTPFGSIFEQFWRHFGAMWGAFWRTFGTHFRTVWESILKLFWGQCLIDFVIKLQL